MTIKLYWWRGEGAQDSTKQNFGDYLSPLIVEMVSGKPVVHASPAHADMIAIGSILSRERKAKRFLIKRKLHIWGAGTDSAERIFSGRHHYHAVRGEKTREQIQGLATMPALGDPGLLTDRWWSGRPKPEKKYRLGLIPHFVDQQNAAMQDLAKLGGVRVISVFDPVEDVARQIQQCDFIASSSMHGLILADSFGIPNRRLVFSRGIISDLKFVDYYSAFQMGEPQATTPIEWIQTEGTHPVIEDPYERPGLESIKDKLVSAFPKSI
ncbi:polysaccharide pyruvyl transferase family protein [Halopseudomonas salina]|uniref:ExoV-like protein n=1 Tax=Halopseudomonas salina TaxID=1323744 RepID=A0ABQ1PPY5_9GAMM|nr:polysaccharide pyruvyl transferase family protein [Halopseudomonas salina]GGD00757.1 exoV-like protein [Halopseudomonas salina]